MSNPEVNLNYINAGGSKVGSLIDLSLSWDDVLQDEDGVSDEVRGEVPQVDFAQDALLRSLNDLGKVDIEYMSKISGMEESAVIASLGTAIYQNPEKWEESVYKGWETAEEYLSGNLIRKWKAAKKANEEYPGLFERNMKGIEAVLPQALNNGEIYITLGSPWVPTDIIDDFIAHLYRERLTHDSRYKGGHLNAFCRVRYGVKHDEITGTWEVPRKTRFKHSVIDNSVFGTKRIEALSILERTLNMKAVVVTDEVWVNLNKRRVVNQEETILALEKQDKLIKEFQSWVWEDEERKATLLRIFESRYGLVRQRTYDGSFLEFPNLNPEITLFPRQKNAVARILFTPNTLLAHDVGAGKTYIMVAAGMELKRTGLSKKNLYVVPNNIVGQWKKIFLELYPNAKVLAIAPKDFTPTKRREVLTKIRDEDFDGIIIAYSSFEQILLSKEERIAMLVKEQEEIMGMVNDLENNLDRHKETKRVDGRFQKIKKEIEELKGEIKKEGKASSSREIFFDELGITRLFIDEAHNFKNLPLDTKNNMVLGINPTGSRKCQAMWDKVRCVETSGGGVIMATGTPITNSVTDIFVMQKYLQYEELRLLELQHFDSWVGMFAEQKTEFEVDVDTTKYRMATRLSQFHNMPELSTLLGQVADFYYRDEEDSSVPTFDGYTDTLLPKTGAFQEFLEDISKRAENIRNKAISRKKDNMLLVTTDGRKGALDLRLVNPDIPFSKKSKVYSCALNIWQIYKETEEKKSTQLVFCDTSTPKQGFNLYDELKRLLVMWGIPKEEIAFVHEAGTEKKKEALFAKMRRGEVRVLVGSTFKLGLGVNVQDKLIALHHLDIPWRPADMVQREGRIIRRGNENKKVKIFRYITEGSFDAYSWQLLETKQRFINELLSGTYSLRNGSDIGDTVLNYAEVKALAIGNPLVKKRVEVSNELSRMLSLRRKTIEAKQALEAELTEIPGKVSSLNARIKKAQDDQQYYEDYSLKEYVPITTSEKTYAAEKRRQIRETIFNAVRENAFVNGERFLMEYKGFKIIIPAHMNPEKPGLWLERGGKYYVSLGESDKGALIRVDNFLENFPSYIEKLNQEVDELKQKEKDIIAELETGDAFSDEIDELRKELERIDKELEVSA